MSSPGNGWTFWLGKTRLPRNHGDFEGDLRKTHGELDIHQQEWGIREKHHQQNGIYLGLIPAGSRDVYLKFLTGAKRREKGNYPE